MKAREINVERLKLKLPRSLQREWNRDRGEALARSVAAGLAETIKQSNLAPSGQSLRAIHVTVPREKANAEGISRAIRTAIGKALPTARKES